MAAFEKAAFPEADAWTDNMPDINGGFNSSSQRKAGGAPAAGVSAAHDEYKKFAKLDLGNM